MLPSGNRLVFLADGRSLVHLIARQLEHSCRVNVWDLNTGERLRAERFQFDGEFKDFEVQPNGSLSAIAGGKQVIVWNVALGSRVEPVLSHDALVTYCRVSGDGATLLTGSQDGMARVWSLGTGKVVAASQAQFRQNLCVALSPDRERFATGSLDGTSRIWATTNGAPLTPPLSQGAPVTGCFFSPNSRWLVTASGDVGRGDNPVRIIRGWDAVTGEPLFVLPLSRLPRRVPTVSADVPAQLQFVCFSRDSRRLHIVLRDGSFASLALEPDARGSPELLRDVITRSGTRPDGTGGLSAVDPEGLMRVFRRD
jgi:WD40 repeat protein